MGKLCSRQREDTRENAEVGRAWYVQVPNNWTAGAWREEGEGLRGSRATSRRAGDGGIMTGLREDPLEADAGEPVYDPRPVISPSECLLICSVGIRNDLEGAKWSLYAAGQSRGL